MPKRAGAKKALVRRVKKAVKKSRRRLGAEKFEKELKRTITFLEKLQGQLLKAVAKPRGAASRKPAREPAGRPGKPAGKSAGQTAVRPSSATAQKRSAKPGRAKKTSGSRTPAS